jgi:hypothetical protein
VKLTEIGVDVDATKRLYMLEHNKPVLGAALSSIPNVSDWAFIIADARDEFGRSFAEHHGNLEESKRLEAEGAIPTIMIAMRVADVASILRRTHPRITAGLQASPAPGDYRVLVFAFGGVTLVHSALQAPLGSA